MQLMPIATNVVSSNPAQVQSTRYIIVIQFVSDLLQVSKWFSPGTPVSSTNKADRYITEILLKVALNTISLT
jgi:hypothetical protein